MNVIDIDPDRISRPPDRLKVLLSEGSQQNQGFTIKMIEIRQYIERTDELLGEYYILTAVIETDKGTVEMKYDEGFRGQDALDSTVTMLTQYVGLSALINRALIELQRF